MEKKRGRGIGRKRYAELIRFLKSVIKNETVSLRVRMQAAERLDGIFARYEQRQLIELRAAARMAEPQESAEPAPMPAEPQSPEDAEREAREFLAQIKRREALTDEQ